MELGNKFAGLTAIRDYYSLRLFPLGVEVFMNDCYYEFAFSCLPIEISITLKITTLFK